MPNKITGDKGKDLLADLKILIANDYEIPCIPISVRNPQANAIVATNLLVILYVPLLSNKWTQIMRALGKEFSHLLCSPYDLQCALPHSIYYHNWYLVGMRSIISTRKPTDNQLKVD